MRPQHGYPSAASCRWSAYGLAIATACFIKIQNGPIFLVLVFTGCRGKKAVKWVWYGMMSVCTKSNNTTITSFVQPNIESCNQIVFLNKCTWLVTAATLLLLLLLLHSFNGLFSRTTQVSRHQKSRTILVKPIWIYWSKRQRVAVASAGRHANLHLAPDR